MKRIAIQFSGLFRGLRFKENRDLQYERTVKSFEDQGFEVDTFWFLYDKELPLDPEIIPNLSTTFNAKHVTVYKDDKIQKILEQHKVMETFSFPPSYYQTSVDNAVLLNFFGEKTKVSKYRNCYGWFKYLFSLKECSTLRKQYENINNVKYDLILTIEPSAIPDSNFLAEKKEDIIYLSGEHSGGYWGSFFMGNEKQIDIICNLYDYMIEKQFKNDNSGITTNLQSEETYKKYLTKNCTVKHTLPKPHKKVRWFFPLGGNDDIDAYLSKYNTSMKKLKETYPEE